MVKKIVIVDDDFGIRDVTKIICERAGFETIVLSSPQPLYEHQHTDASIILLDRQLGIYDGLEVCKDIKQQPDFANIPVLIMSATCSRSLHLANSFADGFVEKPFCKKDLLLAIEELCNKKKPGETS